MDQGIAYTHKSWVEYKIDNYHKKDLSISIYGIFKSEMKKSSYSLCWKNSV